LIITVIAVTRRLHVFISYPIYYPRLVPARATICLEGTKASMLMVPMFACGTLMVTETLNLYLTGSSFVNSAALI
jgi:hypothetical protein